MQLFDLREPVNAWSHGVGMILALPVTWILWQRCSALINRGAVEHWHGWTREQRIKALCLLIFGSNLTMCYGISATYHGARLTGDSLGRLQRLDHVGIYLLIAGTYTPVAWSLMRGTWRWGTLATVWTVAFTCAARVWYAGILPPALSTLVYLTMGWGSLFCYRELARTYSHRVLLPLPLGGVFYSIGAGINLAHWPVFYPGVFAAHELFHFFVMAGSAWHVYFLHEVVAPAEASLTSQQRASDRPSRELIPSASVHRGRRWRLHFAPLLQRNRGELTVRTRNRVGEPLDGEATLLDSAHRDGATGSQR